ncbi:hypothetical protein, partial [Chromobacterium vaccinii]|uniref:hypothetical protein n=1 Tax=Chromobacterium vaccinii TaxID=1108595 RepID=UPI001F41324A
HPIKSLLSRTALSWVCGESLAKNENILFAFNQEITLRFEISTLNRQSTMNYLHKKWRDP